MSNQNLPKLFFFNIEPWKTVPSSLFISMATDMAHGQQ